MTRSIFTFLAAWLALAAAPAALAATDAGLPAALAELPLPPVPEPLDPAAFGAPSAFPRGRALYVETLAREAESRGLPPAVADAVTMVESAYNPQAVGGVGEIGLMQILPSTAHLLGFRGSLAELAVPATNMHYGVKYLAEAWRLADGDLCRTLMKYRAGHREERMSLLSVTYCIRARNHLASIGSPLAKAPVPEAVAIAGFAPVRGPGGAGRRRGGGRLALRAARPISRAIWTASNARLQAIDARYKASEIRIMSSISAAPR